MTSNIFKRVPDSRAQIVRVFFEKYEQWAISEHKFLQVPAAFELNPAVPLTPSELAARADLIGEFEVLALEANKNLVDLQKYIDKMKRDGHTINFAEWQQWKHKCFINPWMATTVASIAPDFGLVKPFSTPDDFNRYRKEDQKILPV